MNTQSSKKLKITGFTVTEISRKTIQRYRAVTDFCYSIARDVDYNALFFNAAHARLLRFRPLHCNSHAVV